MNDNPFEPMEESPDETPEAPETTEAKSPLGRLLDGNATGPAVSELESDYGIGKPWSIGLRGIVRAATGSGIPPLAEISLAGVMGAYRLQEEHGSGDAQLGDLGGDGLEEPDDDLPRTAQERQR